MKLRSRATHLLVAAVTTVGGSTLLSTAALAQPSLSVAPQAGEPGEQLTATVAGFSSGAVTLHVDAIPGIEVGSVNVTSTADFAAAFTIPGGLPPGGHLLLACLDRAGSDCRELARAPFEAIATQVVIITPTTAATTTTEPQLALATTTTTTIPSVQIPSMTTTLPRLPPVIAGPTSSTNPDPPFTTRPEFAISTTSPPLPEAQPPGEIIADVSIRGIEVTQGIQNLTSSMPLVAGRRTTVRVHVGVEPGFAIVDGALLVERPSAPDEVLLPDNGPISPPFERTDLDGALNFTLEPRHYAAGEVTFTAQVWSAAAGIASIADEPDDDNNLLTEAVEFHTGQNPTVWLVALDDGAGPGPDITDLTAILDLAIVAYDDLLDFHPIAGVNFEVYPDVAGPGPEATEPGLWDLGLDQEVEPTAHDRRHEPNLRMAQLVVAGVLGDEGDMVLGRIDPSIPTAGFTGWAGYGVAWSKPEAGTPSHEVAHNQGLDHVNCAGDTDGDNIPQEAEAGAIDISHPDGLPPVCSLAPIDPDGYFGYTTYRSPVAIYSNDPSHPQAAFPFMGYKTPGWSDPYHYCRLLDSYGVPCNPAVIGVPPRHIVTVDCDPEPVGGGSPQLDLCIVHELPPDPDPAPQSQEIQLATPVPASVAANAAGIETLTLQSEAITFDIPVDPDSWVLVTGTVGPGSATGEVLDATASATTPQPVANELALTIESVAAGVPAAAALRLVDAQGAALTVVPVGTSGGGHDGDGHGGGGGQTGTGGGSTPFLTAVPRVEGATALELLVDGVVADTFAIAPTAPQVTDVEVSSGAGGLTVSWQSAGIDGDATFTVRWSNDGETWIPIAAGVPAAEALASGSPSTETSGEDSRGLYQINISPSAPLPGGDDVRVEVIATDRARSGAARSAAFSAPTQPPLAGIAGAPAGPVEQHDVVELHAVVVDPDGAIPADPAVDGRDFLIWRDHLGNELGTGNVLVTRDLPVGVHTISLVARDPNGNESVADVTVEVVERTTPTRYTETPDPATVQYVNRFQAIPDSVSASTASPVDDVTR